MRNDSFSPKHPRTGREALASVVLLVLCYTSCITLSGCITPQGPSSPGASPANTVVVTGKRLPSVLSQIIPQRNDAVVIEAEDCSATAMHCHAMLELNSPKNEAFEFYKNALIRDGWVFDTGLNAPNESGSLGEKNLWGLLNFNKGKFTLTIVIPSDFSSKGTKTLVDFDLINRGANDDITDFIKGIPKVQRMEKP